MQEDASTATYRSFEIALRAAPYVALCVIAVSAFLFLAGANAARVAAADSAAAAGQSDSALSAQLHASERGK